jgi:DUF3040 family protein
MGLVPGEQRTLAEIESQLRRSDPRLAVMFASFAADGARRRPLRDRLAARRPASLSRARLIVLIVTSVTLIVTCVAVAIAATSRTAPGGVLRPGVTRVGTYLPGS